MALPAFLHAVALSEFVFQVKDVKFSQDGFVIIRTTRGESVKGNFAAREGLVFKAEGKWDKESQSAQQYGPTFYVETAEIVREMDPVSFARFLTLQLKNTGVGEAFLTSLAQTCAEEQLNLEHLLDTNDATALLELVGKRNANKVTILLAKWPEIKPQADLITPLLNYGLSSSAAEQLVLVYGKEAVDVVETRPYSLILELSGIGFLKADAIATKVGIPKTHPIRLRAALAHGLRIATDSGDHGVPRRALLDQTMPLVNESVLVGSKRKLDPDKPITVSYQLLTETLSDMIAGKPAPALPGMASDATCGFASELLEYPDRKGEVVVWYRPLVIAESVIARRLSELSAPPRPDLVAKVRQTIEAQGVTFAPEQEQAVINALTHPVSVITGGPGCGKSFLLQILLNVLDGAGHYGKCCAPTGKAAKRIQEATGRKSETIHRTVGIRGGVPTYHSGNHLPIKYLVIDESSMADTELFAMLVAAIPPDARLIIVGDVDQLASVGPGQVLRDLINSEVIPVTRLTKGWRFKGGLAEAARTINAGKVPQSSEDGQFNLVETDSPAEALMAIIDDLLVRGVSPDDIQVLAPIHKHGAGVTSINKMLQARFNPEPKNGTAQRLRRENGNDIRVGDRVMCTKNDKDTGLVNGDIGWVDELDIDPFRLTMSLPDREAPLTLQAHNAVSLTLAYGSTIHKSQGAEAPYVLVVLDPASTFMLSRSLVYTGITRAKLGGWLIGDYMAIASAVRKGEPKEGRRRTSQIPKLHAAFKGRPRYPEPILKDVPPASTVSAGLAAAMSGTVEVPDI